MNKIKNVTIIIMLIGSIFLTQVANMDVISVHVENGTEEVEDSTKKTDEIVEEPVDTKDAPLEKGTRSTPTETKYFMFDNGEIIGYQMDGPKDVVLPETYKDSDNNIVNITKIGDRAFAGMQLTSFEFNSQITSIGNEAFRNNAQITSMIIPDTVTSIGTYAFSGCTTLANVTLPVNITTISNYMFENCKALNLIVLGAKITSIGEFAFRSCSSLTSINIPDGVTSIGKHAFYFCTSLQSADLPDSVTSLGSYTFSSCSALRGMRLSENLTSLPDNLFYNSGLTSIIIPNKVTNIYSYAFQSNRSLTSVTLGTGLRTISSYAFQSCTTLKNIVIPDNVISIGFEAFVGTSDIAIRLDNREIDSITGSPWGAQNARIYWKEKDTSCYNVGNNGVLLGYKPSDHNVCLEPSKHTETELNIPSTIGEQTITSIAPSAFKGNKNLRKVVIPDTVKNIGSYAFSGCSNLSDLSIGGAVTEINEYAFYATILKNVIIPDSVKTVSQYAFDTSTLKKITFGSGINYIGSYAFNSTNSLEVYLESKEVNTVTGSPWGGNNTKVYWKGMNDDDSCFYVSNSGVLLGFKPEGHTGCKTQELHTNPSTLKIPSVIRGITVKEIQPYAFRWNSGIRDVVLPDTITAIGQYAFSNCRNLKTIKMSNNLKTIGRYAFQYCFELLEVSLPDGFLTLGNDVFTGCNKLTKVDLGNSLTRISSSSFNGTSALKEIIIPDSVTNIDSNAFSSSGLTNIVIPDSVTTISSSAFSSNKKLQYVSLGRNVKSIGGYAFSDTIITEISFPETITSVDLNALPNTVKNVYVDAVRRNFEPRINQPWGAATDAKIHYRGEFIEGFTTVKYSEDFGKATVSLNLKAETGGLIQSIQQPGGKLEENIGKNEYTTHYEITKPGLYIYKVGSTYETRDFEVYIDQLNPIAVEGFDFLIKDTVLQNATEADLVKMAAGKAYMKDAPTTPLNISIEPTLDVIKNALKNEGDKVSVKLKASGKIQGDGDETLYSSEKNITLTYTTHNFYTVTFKDYDGSIIDKQTVMENDEAVTPMHPKRTGYTFIGWDKTFTNITQDTVVKAEYRILPKWTGRTSIDIPIKQTFNAKEHIKAVDGDGNTPTTVSHSGSVNTSKVGSYTVIYTMIDEWGGTSKQSVIFKVKEKVSINSSAKESISGKNVIMTLEEIKKGFKDNNLGAILIEKADINAVNMDDGTELKDLIVDTSKILENKGSYSFDVKTAKTTLNLNVQIYDHCQFVRGMNGEDAYLEFIYANDFTISQEESANITAERVIALANANAYDEVIAKEVKISVEDISTIQNKPRGKASYPLTFTTAIGTKVTVNVTVVDNSGLNTANSEYICANDIYLSKDQVTSLKDEEIKKISKVSAVKLTGEDVAVSVTNAIKAERGAYDIYFITALGTTMTIKARVYDHKVNNGTETIYVNDTQIDESEAASGSETDFIKFANAKAFDSITENSIAISMKDINAIKNKKRGIYTVGWKTNNGTEITSKITVRGNAVTTGTTRISGNNFAISVKDITSDETQLNELLIKTGNVQAYTLEGFVQNVLVKDKSALKKVPGIYNVIFKSDNNDNAELTLQVEVKENGSTNETTKEILTANDIQISKDQVSKLNADNGKLLIQLANARAVNTNDGTDVIVTSATSNAQASKGEYSATFRTAAGTTLNTKVTVQDKGNNNTVNQEYISANDFKITINEFENAVKSNSLNEVLLKKANVRANDIESGRILEASVKSHTVINKKGKYSVIFQAPKGTEVSVTAIVVDEAVIDSVKNEAIYANDFAISLEDTKSITNDKLISWANAYAENIVTGTRVTVSVKTRNIESKLGVYEVTFMTPNGTEATVQVTVKPSGTTNSTNKESLYASDFQLKMSEVDTINNTLLIKRAGAQARDENGYEVAITGVEHSIQKSQGKYDVTFKTQKGTSLKVIASVSSEVVENGNEIIKANDFKISIGEVKTASEARLIQLASAKAYKLDSGAEVKVSLKTKGLLEKIGTYDVVFQTENGTNITVSGTVTNSSGSQPAVDEEIYANDFTVSVDEVQKGLSNAELIAKARVDAVEVATGKKLTIQVESKLEAKAGVYDIVFKTEKNTQTTIQATVTEKSSADNINPVKQDLIYASDFSLSVEEALHADENDLISMAKAKAYEKNTGASVSITVKDQTLLTGKNQGNYKVTFVSANGSEIEVTATITKSNGSNPDTTIKERITANDFSVKASEVEGLKPEDIIALAKAKAVNSETGAVLVVSVNSQLKAKKGVYDVTFSTEKKTTITVQGTVIENDSADNNDPAKVDLIYANNFTLSVAEAAAITEQALISLANAKAYDKASGAPVSVSVDISQIKDKPQGIYQVTFESTNGSTIEVTATITKSSVVNPDTSVKERITANDFSVKASEVDGLKPEDIIALAKAKAVNSETGEDIAVEVTSGLQNKKGVYNVTFSTEKQTTITVKGTVLENSSPVDKEHILYANGFSISEADAKSVDEAKLIKLANAKAYDKASGAPVTVNVEVNQILNKPQGQYDVTYKTGKTEITVSVIVTKSGNSVIVGNDTEHITANDFSISVEEMKSQTLDKDLISLAKAKAYVEETGEVLNVLVGSKPEAKKGVYDVTFKTTNGTSITVQGTVVDKSSPVDKEHTLYANGFSISEADAKSVDEAKLIKLANAKAYDKASGAPVTVNVEVNQILNKPQGQYDVIYKTGKTEITVSVIVTKSGNSGTVGNETEYITANDFSISVEEMKSQTLDKDLISLAKAKAYVEETGEVLNVLVDSKPEAKKGVYDVTFKTTNGTSITVQGTVVDKSSPSNKEHILYANGFSISEADAKSVDEAKLIKLANAKAYDKASGAPVTVNVEVNQILNKPQGQYDVIYKTGKTEITVSVIVTKSGNSGTVGNETEYITANDFSISVEEMKSQTLDKDLISLAKAKAYVEETGEVLNVLVDSKPEAKKGVYDVTFKTKNGTSITVQGTVIENDSADNNDPAKVDLIYANNFTLSVAEAASITEQALISLANAKAYDKASGAPVTVKVEVNQILGKPQGNYKVTFESANGSTIEVTATITKSSGSNPDTNVKERITANDFSVKESEVEGLKPEDIIAIAKAKAENRVTGEVLEIFVNSQLKAKKGVYDVTFSTEKQTTITVQGTVIENDSADNNDPAKVDLIYANNFTLSVAEAASITEQALINLANAKAYDKASGAPVSVSVDISQIKDKPQGNYKVTFVSANGSTIEVTATITKSSVVNPDTSIKERITANDFSVKASEVDGLKPEDIIALAKAKAENSETGEDIVVEVTSGLQNKKGVYDVTFSTEKQTTITVQGTVIENDSADNNDPAKTDLIYANNFTLSVAEASSITEQALISLANAKAYDKASGAPVSISVDISQIKDKPQGIYKVTFKSANGSSIEVTATITKSSGSNPDTNVKERITANDFSVKVSEVEGLKPEDIIALAKAKAVNSETGEDIVVEVTSGLQNKKGVYDVTFSTEKQTTITVQGTVIENDSADNNDPAKTDLIYANNFTLSVAEASSITEQALISLANAKAYDKASGAPVSISVDISQIKDKPQGIYKVTFESANGSTIEVTATVTKSSGSNPDTSIKERITANDFSIKASEVEGLKPEDIIALAKAKAENSVTGEVLEVSVNSQLKAKKGVYDVTFSTEKQTTIIVQGTVIENDSADNNDPAKTDLIYANNFTLSVAEAASITEQALINLANAKAYDKASGAPVSISVDISQIKDKPQGIYKVTFESANGSTIEVTATVTKSSGSNPDTSIKERITANDFSVKESEVEGLKPEDIIALAKAKAVNSETGEDITIEVISGLRNKKGVYDVVFKTTKNTAVTVKGTVVDNSSSTDSEHILYANSFTISEAEAKTIDEEGLVRLANANAYDKTTGALVNVSTDVNQIRNKKQGRYEMIFETTKTELKVIVFIVGNSENAKDPETGETIRISANDIYVTVEEVNRLSEEDLIQLADAKAYVEETGAEKEIKVLATPKVAKGVYTISFTIEGQIVQTNVKMNVLDRGYIASKINEKIYANDIWISKKIAESIEEERLIWLSRARAIEIETGEVLDVAIKENNIKGKTIGTYDVVYTGEKGSELTSKIHIMDEGILNEELQELISANNFVIDAKKVESLEVEEILKLSKAKATDVETGAELEVKAEADLQARNGIYPIRLKTEKGTEVEIQVTVENEVNEDIEVGNTSFGKSQTPSQTLPTVKEEIDVKKPEETKKEEIKVKDDKEAWKKMVLPIWMILYVGVIITQKSLRKRKLK